MNRIYVLCFVLTHMFCQSASLPAALVDFELAGLGGTGLLPTNEIPVAASTGSGGEIGAGIQFDDVTKQLFVNVAWGNLQGFDDLTGPVTTAAWRTAGAGQGINGTGIALSVLIVDNNSADNGLETATINVNPAQETLLLNGDTYLSFRTATNPNGEIRGNLIVSSVPEPGAGLTLAFLTMGVLARRRRRRD